MNKIGMSTACFYPLETEISLERVGELGFHTTELFLNSPAELECGFIDKLSTIQKKYDIDIVSVHTYASFTESYYYFSSYKRRYFDSIDGFKRYFDLTNAIGAKYIVMHGSKIPGSVSDEEYCERFSTLTDIAKEHGVRLLQENVVHYRSENPDYIEIMKKNIGKDFGMVLDIKQSYRTGFDAFEFIKRHHDVIKHVHISDKNERRDCIPPLEGNFDFKRMFDEMNSYGYEGDYIIELYENSYNSVEQILNAAKGLEALLK